jgi:hypothetical protein
MTEDHTQGIGWLTYLKVGVTVVIGLVAMVFAPRVTEGASGSDLFWMVVFMLGIGGIAGYLSFRELRERQLMLNTPTSKIRSMAVGDVEVKGEARPVEEPLTSPLSQSEACIYEFEVKERDTSGENTEWDTVLKYTQKVPFYVDDGTGQVRVESDQADLDVSVDRSVTVGRKDLPPANVREWAETDAGQELLDTEIPREEGQDSGVSGKMTDAFESHFQGQAERHLTKEWGSKRRYKERVLGAGESTYIFGGAYPREGVSSATNAENLVIREHEGTGKLIVSDKSETERAAEGLFNVALLFAIAVALVPAGLLALWRLLSG